MNFTQFNFDVIKPANFYFTTNRITKMKKITTFLCIFMCGLTCSILATTGGCGDGGGGGGFVDSGSSSAENGSTYTQHNYAPAGPGGNRMQPRNPDGTWEKTSPERPTVTR